jgi:hypothetical protein
MKKLKTIKDIIYNNPRADKQDNDTDDKIEKEIKSKMLFDDLKKRMKTAYQKKKRQDKINDLNSRPSSWEGLI